MDGSPSSFSLRNGLLFRAVQSVLFIYTKTAAEREWHMTKGVCGGYDTDDCMPACMTRERVYVNKPAVG